MNKFTEFIGKHFNIIALALLVILFLRTCNSDTKSINKRIDALTTKVDSLQSTAVTKKDLQVEGLKVEKRMIQSTDRKILDVNRQSQIDKEIENLSK
jgi:PBP1b-binding outer membrane lipoprotein LpoB